MQTISLGVLYNISLNLINFYHIFSFHVYFYNHHQYRLVLLSPLECTYAIAYLNIDGL